MTFVGGLGALFLSPSLSSQSQSNAMDHFRKVILLHVRTPPDHSWIELCVNIEVDCMVGEGHQIALGLR